jgi:hypothetical protein
MNGSTPSSKYSRMANMSSLTGQQDARDWRELVACRRVIEAKISRAQTLGKNAVQVVSHAYRGEWKREVLAEWLSASLGDSPLRGLS